MKSPVPERWKTFFSARLPSIHIGLILLLGIASYANSLAVPLHFDDENAVRIVNNLGNNLYSIRGLISTPRWFTDITFAVNRTLHGEQVLGYHLVNLAVHLSTAAVIYLFIQRAIEALQQTFQIPVDANCPVFLQYLIPFSAAALFVCHPIQTQAVTYIAQRYTSLTTLLYVSSLLSYLLARISFSEGTKNHRAWLWGSVCLVLALLAMKSKEIAFTLPLMATVIEVALFRGRMLRNRLFLTLGILLLLIIPLQLIYSHSTRNPENLLQSIQSATSETQNISRVDYLLTQFKVVATYLRLLVLPVSQNVDYDYPVYHSLFTPSVLAALLLHISLATLGLILFIHSQRCLTSGRSATGIASRIVSLGIFWFYLAMSVESTLIPIRDVIFEHRIYLPSVGFFMAAAAGIAGIASYHQRYPTVFWGVIVLLCFVCMAGTIARNRVWSSELALWQDALEKSPNKARPHNFVGVLYFRKYMPEKALPHLVRALELDAGIDRYWISLNSALWIINRYEGRCSDGMEYHATLDKVDPRYRKPWMAISYNNLGLAYEHLGNRFLAWDNYQKAVITNPSLDLAWYNLALLAAWRNDQSTVESALERLRTINPLLEQNAVDAIRKNAPSVQLVPQ